MHAGTERGVSKGLQWPARCLILTRRLIQDAVKARLKRAMAGGM